MCPETSELSACFDRELPADRLARIESHIADCPACRATLELFDRQRRTLLADEPVIAANPDRLQEFWGYVGHARLRKVSGPRRLSVPLPVAAAAGVALILATLLNFIPQQKSNMPDVLVLEAPQPAPTVVSLTVTPGELDAFFAALEGQQALDGEGILVLPAELPMARLGEPEIVRPASFQGAP